MWTQTRAFALTAPRGKLGVMGKSASSSAETVLIKVPEKALPDRILGAFAVFEDALAAERDDDPDWIDRPYQGFDAAFFPHRDSLRPTSRKQMLGLSALILFLGTLLLAITTIVTLFLPESMMRPVVLGGAVVIGGGTLLLLVLYLRGELRDNRRKRDRSRPPAYGTFLLADGMIERYETRCFYYPRSTILEVFEDAIKGGGGGTGGSSWTIGHSAEIRYRDAAGKEKTTGVFSEVSRWQPTPNGAAFRRIEKWFDATADRA